MSSFLHSQLEVHNPTEDRLMTVQDSTGVLETLLKLVGNLVDQPYEVNLQLTCVLSRLALLPRSVSGVSETVFWRTPEQRSAENSLPGKLRGVIDKLLEGGESISDMKGHLISLRASLVGDSIEREEEGSRANSPLSSPYEGFLSTAILLEEFCKELAAVACVKARATAAIR